MPDESHTYAAKGPKLDRVMLYAPPGYTPPNELELEGPDGKRVTIVRLADSSLVCHSTIVPDPKTGKNRSTGECKSAECHRRKLGYCQCGRHTPPVRIQAAS